MMMSSLLIKSLLIQVMLGDKGIMFITLVIKNFQDCGVRFESQILSQLLESYLVVQQHHSQMKEFLIILLMSLVMGIFILCLLYLITGSISQHHETCKSNGSNMPNFEE
uniref:Uncharacterized protein n=1 Tax=Amphimedon queenslandica TaxID=400682 RepID=A0A1X7U844_AMPQE